jgi:hypothetical protein
MLSYLLYGGQQHGIWRRAGAAKFTQQGTAPHCAVIEVHRFRKGPTQTGQGQNNYQHDFPAALPLRRKPDFAFAAI